ncbi:S-adenosyl-methyltransferase [Leptobacterium flavescens]|uniref:S-adenosyl-methyltransferase n=1 Tax=Leptobacterium flavescens TaxID=472055 RepID=A0A6P0UGW7_9FLAO|nr:FtsL-like putative cell division protein [Leptobacterium flavescens]NER12484.1 S-adenosyl-methyltransferase [Leptobacterium flavescens]
MRESIIGILKGRFLISDDSIKNWRFILFVSSLAVLMIASAHSIDKKVIGIAELNEDVQELRSEFVDTRSELQKLKLESTVTESLKEKGLSPSVVPPKKIKISSK